MPRISEMFAFIAEDQGPDDEGVIGMEIGGSMMPLVGADMARVDSLRPFAEQIGLIINKKIKLVKFTTRTDVEEL